MVGERKWTWTEKVQAERGRRAWSYAELARRIDEDPDKVRKWLVGAHDPQDGGVQKIARALGWPIEYLYRDDLPYSRNPAGDFGDEWVTITMRSLDDRGKRVASACADRDVAAFLNRMLEVYEETVRRSQASTAPDPQTHHG